MNRRHFFKTIGILGAALAVDPEQLLWVPGKKKIFLPSPERQINFFPLVRVREPLQFHAESFSMVWPPMEISKEDLQFASKNLADSIDRDIMNRLMFGQWSEPLPPLSLSTLREAQQAMNDAYSKQLQTVRVDILYGFGTIKKNEPDHSSAIVRSLA